MSFANVKLNFGVNDDGTVIFSVLYKNQLIHYTETAILKTLKIYVQGTPTIVDNIAVGTVDKTLPALSKNLPSPSYDAKITEDKKMEASSTI